MPEYRVTTERTTPGVATAHVTPVTHVVPVPAVTQTTVDDFTGETVQTPHKAADDTEQIYFEGSPMLRAEFGKGVLWVALGLIVAAAPFGYLMMQRDNPNAHLPWWVFAAATVVGLAFIFVPWLRMKTVKYRISNYRIDFQRGLVGRTIDTMELWHVEDIQFKQSFLHRLLGVGTIIVLSHDDTTPKLTLWGLPNPKPLFESLKQRVIAVKRQRGVVKMDVG